MDNQNNLKVLVVIITKDKVESECLDSVLNQDYPKSNRDVLIHIKEPQIKHINSDEFQDVFKSGMLKYLNCSVNREAARKIALASDAERFLFVDSDIKLPSNAISELALQPFDVIGGWYKVQMEERYTCGRWIDDNVFINLYKIEPSIVKVDQIGMGCAMFSRKVLSEISFHHGVDMWAKTFIGDNEANLMLGECGALGNLLYEKGYQPYMDGNVVCNHILREELYAVDY